MDTRYEDALVQNQVGSGKKKKYPYYICLYVESKVSVI